jgi:5-formyltetrahydrofolate cyclo-ligase
MDTPKSALRIHHLAARERMDPLIRQQAAQVLAELLPPLVPPGASVAGYVPHRGEIDVRPAMAQLATKGHALCLPGIEASDKPLFFRRWRVGDALAGGRYGIPIPEAESPLVFPAVLLVPLVVFDRAGHRLGYGAGYYDRTIAQLRARGPVLAIGAAYAQQEVAHIPADAYDQRLDWVVTEKELIRIYQ